MAPKVLTSSIVICSFHVSRLLIHLCTCIPVSIRFRYQRSDICADSHMIYILRMAVLNRIRGWFYYVLRLQFPILVIKYA